MTPPAPSLHKSKSNSKLQILDETEVRDDYSTTDTDNEFDEKKSDVKKSMKKDINKFIEA